MTSTPDEHEGSTPVTADVIAQLLRTAEEAEQKFQSREFASKDSAMEAAENLCRSADRIAGGDGISVEDALQAMRKYGRCRGIARQYDIEIEIDNCLARQGQVLRNVITVNRDEARLAASELLEKVSESYAKRGDRREAGIELTNAALCLLEMSDPSSMVLGSARDKLERSIILKSDSYDLAYSRFNLALCLRRIADAEADTEAVLQRADRLLDRSMKVFEDYEDDRYNRTYRLNKSQIARGLMRLTRRRKSLATVLAHRGEVSTVFLSSFDKDPLSFASGLINNPPAYGIDAAPAWATPVVDVSEYSARFREEIEGLDRVVDSVVGSARGRILWERHLIVCTYTNEWTVDDDSVAALEIVWDCKDYHSFFDWACKLIHYTVPGRLRSDYTSILSRLASCIFEFRRSWAVEGLRRLLDTNDTTFRFLACKLVELSRYEEAFALLEATRGLVSSRTLRLTDVSSEGEEKSEEIDCAWVHVTHSPDCAAVVGLNENKGAKSYFGCVFPELSGRNLAVRFSGLLESGLITAQAANDRKAAVRAADSIAGFLGPVADYVHANVTSSSLRIHPGGYFQAFPMASILTSAGDVLGAMVETALGPSRTLLLASSNTAASAEPILVASAAAVAGLQPLTYAALDEQVIDRHFDTVAVSASPVDLRALDLGPGTTLHFTGHSVADWDPGQSKIFLYGGALTASEILESGPKPDYCVLSSCQSGAAQNFKDQDEYLSLQSAFIYKGGSLAIGTAWPVGDFVAFCFTARLYGELSARESTTLTAWIECFWAAQSWLRAAQVEELRRLLGEMDANVQLPAFLDVADGSFRPFAEFYDWAAFSLMARLDRSDNG